MDIISSMTMLVNLFIRSVIRKVNLSDVKYHITLEYRKLFTPNKVISVTFRTESLTFSTCDSKLLR